MSIDILREALQRRPFEPFRVVVSSGDTYEVRHPEMALVVKKGVYIGLPDEDDVPDKAVYCSLAHIAAIETAA